MRLSHIHIKSTYKNLTDFKIDFDGISFIDVFVGKNGTGKSNLFEALIEIFRHLFEKEYIISFDYLIQFELEKKKHEISWIKQKLTHNGKEVGSISKKNLPDNIIIYYSGHNSKVTSLVQDYENSFRKEIKNANIKDTREFIGIGKEYKGLLLATLLMQPESSKAREFICDKLEIAKIDNILRIVLKRPFYANSDSFNIVNNDQADRFWKADGITKQFLNRLLLCLDSEPKGPIRTEGYLSRDDRYILYFDIAKIIDQFKNDPPQDFFRQFDNLKTIQMLFVSTIMRSRNDKPSFLFELSIERPHLYRI